MFKLDRFRVETKVKFPIWILTLFTLSIAALSLYVVQNNLKEGHIDKVQALVNSAKSIAMANYRLSQEGRLSREEAQTRSRDAIRSMIFDGGSRVFVFNEQGIRIVSNQLYSEGTSAWKAKQTKSMIRQAMNGGGLTYYNGARVKDGIEQHSLSKVAWSEHFAPWGWVIASAVYLDDVADSFWQNLIEMAAICLAGGAIVMLIAKSVISNITDPLTYLTGNLKKLADGETDISIEGTERKDELGDMATAMKTLVNHENQRQQLQRQLKRMAYTDKLTGLANRAMFYEAIQKELKLSLQDGSPCALMIIDLDRFKAINDTLGHIAGDAVLTKVAKRLLAIVGERGIVGRLSGDEFYVFLPQSTDKSEVESLSHAIVHEIEKPFDLECNIVQVGVSIGIAYGPEDAACDSNLYRFADVALYEAKQTVSQNIMRYSPEMAQKAERRYELEALIKEGLEKDQFHAYFQAKIDLDTGRIRGAEALCRWQQPKQGFISPAEFIPIAEETGSINEIGYRMLKQACEFAVRCNEISPDLFTVAVNVSAKQLMFGRFLATLGRCLEETECNTAWLELEITESLLLTDQENTAETLHAISDMGIGLSIDDFGTGYSAMSYLARYPITCLKIDQSFVSNMCVDSQKHVLVSAILAMASGLGLKTVAEGVEDAQTAKELKALKCDRGQGYFWHRPSAPDELFERLKRSNAA